MNQSMNQDRNDVVNMKEIYNNKYEYYAINDKMVWILYERRSNWISEKGLDCTVRTCVL